MRYFAKCSYDGTNFIGWQVQPEGRSIQEEIERVISTILNKDTRIFGSGRTDAGVHAFEQTFHFDSDKSIVDLEKFRYSCNRMLPKDIYITFIALVDDNFHARYDVVSKTYLYRLNTGLYDVFDRQYTAQFLRDLDVNKMAECAPLFIGKHCFQNFTTKEEDKNDFERTIYAFEIYTSDDLILFHINGTGFMRYMVRIIVGTLIEVGLGRLTKDDIVDLLEKKERSISPYKAPPEGLYLMNVEYGKHEDA